MVHPATQRCYRARYHYCKYYPMPAWRSRNGTLRDRSETSPGRRYQRLRQYPRMRSHQTNVPSRPWSQPGRNPLPHELRPCGRNHQSISHSQTTLKAKKINFPLLSKIPITIKLLKLKGKMSN